MRPVDPARTGAKHPKGLQPNSILVPSSDALVSNSFLLLLVRHLLLEAMHLFLVAFLFLIANIAPSSKARSYQ